MRECDRCGLAGSDLPDMDLEEDEMDMLFMRMEDGRTLCAGCENDEREI